MGDGGLDLLRDDGKITLVYNRAPDQRAMATLHSLFMGGITAVLLYVAVLMILHADPAQSALMVPVCVGCAGFAVWNGIEPQLQPDYTTVFDLTARTATVTESNSFSIRRRGPVSFDDVAGLGTRINYVVNRRSIIVWLLLKNGEEWRLGHDAIGLRQATASQFVPMIAKLRGELGLGGGDADKPV
jgi:hypothetical protein